MSQVPAASLLHRLLLQQGSRKRLWASLAAMSVGLFLLLAAVLLWWNFNFLLQGNASVQGMGGSYLTLSRRVTNESMGQLQGTTFSPSEIEALRHAPQVEDLGEIHALKRQAYMRLQVAAGLGFSTVMVLESVPDRFIDQRPALWGWSPGSRRVPVILSATFLSLYNYVFAPSQGLPQLSEASIKALPFSLELGDGNQTEHYVAQVVGFSNRISSVLAPETFIQALNGQVGADRAGVSRVVVKVKDPSDPGFTDFLRAHDLVTNTELGRWSALRALVNSVVLFVGLLAVILLFVSVLVFVLFLELNVARVRASVALLQELGFSQTLLGQFLQRKFQWFLLLVLGIAMGLGLALQGSVFIWGEGRGLHFRSLPGWPFWVCVALMCIGLWVQLKLAVARAINQVSGQVS